MTEEAPFFVWLPISEYKEEYGKCLFGSNDDWHGGLN